jgi:VWFA-related protein
MAWFLLANLYNPYNPPLRSSLRDQEILQHEVTVTLKLVQVYVHDKKREPVLDLEKSDFLLYDNGELKSITDFEKHILDMPSGGLDQGKNEAGTAKANEKLPRKFFLFFDLAFNTPAGFQDSKKAALHFIDTKLQPSDEVGVLSFSTVRNLAVYEYLTNDHQKVREVVEGIGLKDILGRAEFIEGKYWQKLGEKSGAGGQNSEIGSGMNQNLSLDEEEKDLEIRQQQSERDVYQHQVSIFSKTLRDMAKAFCYIPGHKHIIFFSGGVASSLFYGKLQKPIMTPHGRDFAEGTFGNSALREEYELMMKELAAANCSVFAVDAGGPASAIDFDRGIEDNRVLGIYSLQRLAEVTGGTYFGNPKNYSAIMEEIQKETGSYYVLGYPTDEKWDGQYHKIRVEVKRKECEVRTQAGYFNPKPFSQFSKIERRLHFLDLALHERPQMATPLDFPLTVLPCSKEEESILVVIGKIPAETIQKIWGEKVEIAQLVFDNQDAVIDFRRWESNFTKLSKKEIYFYSLASLAPGDYRFRVVLRNLKTGRTALAFSPVSIAEIPVSGLSLSRPLLLIPQKDASYLRGAILEPKPTRKEVLGLLNIYPYDISHYSPLVGEVSQGTAALFVVLRCSLYDLRQPDLKLYTRLAYDPSGEKIPLPVLVLKKYQEDGARIYLLQVQIDKLLAGNYKLDFVVEDAGSQAGSHVTAAFEVK